VLTSASCAVCCCDTALRYDHRPVADTMEEGIRAAFAAIDTGWPGAFVHARAAFVCHCLYAYGRGVCTNCGPFCGRALVPPSCRALQVPQPVIIWLAHTCLCFPHNWPATAINSVRKTDGPWSLIIATLCILAPELRKQHSILRAAYPEI
jgi:hypothetical protein